MPDYPENKRENAEQTAVEEVCPLGAYIERVFRDAEDIKRESGIEAELMECLRQSRSEYNEHDKTIIQQLHQPDLYYPLSDMKRRTANSWTTEIFLYAADPPWRMRPTPVPELATSDADRIAEETMEDFVEYSMMQYIAAGVPQDQAMRMVYENPPDPDVVAKYAMMKRDETDNKRMEVATRKVERMEKLCHDQQVEGKWMTAMASVIDCASTFGTGILKGPMAKMKKLPKFNKTNGVSLKDTKVYEWESINPFDAYPAKGATEITDGDFCQYVSYTPKDLNAMKKLGKEYFASNINTILETWPNGGCRLIRTIDSEKSRLENKGTPESKTGTMIEGIEFWGDVRGSVLKDYEITEYAGKTLEDDIYYEINAIVINKLVIFCSITDEKLGRPLFKGTFFKTQGSWWGDSPMNKMRDVQRECNASMRNLCHNMAQASGPMGFVSDVTRLLPSFDYRFKSWSITAFKDPMRTGRSPITLFQAASNAAEFRAIRDASIKDADIVTGIPAYSHGSDIAAGAGRTSSGLAMLMGAATRGMKQVVNSISYDILIPALTYQYRMNLMYHDDPGVKGDANVDVGGVLAILLKDQNYQRVSDFLTLANNPAVAAVMGKSGIAELLRVYLKLLDGINPDRIIKSREDLEKEEQMDRIMAQLGQAEQQGMAMGIGGAQPSAGPVASPSTAPSTMANPENVTVPRQQPQPTVMMEEA